MKDRAIDLRSDTVTRPTNEMRKAMARAHVGDDVYAEDPTANRLQDMAAQMLGFDAGLFLPSGTMGNQVAIKTHTDLGDEIIVEKDAHILNYELAAMSAISGVMPRPVKSETGVLPVEDVEKAVQADTYYLAHTKLVTIENTHNNHGGRIYPISDIRELVQFARSVDIPVHMDGARLFNAARALDVEPADIVDGLDSVMFCLSKGLGAPVGSMLVGGKEFIEKARVERKRFGGGMRQVGILAAAGIYALENNVDRLGQDHENAKNLARGLKKLGFEIKPDPVETNIFFVDMRGLELNAPDLTRQLDPQGIRISPRDKNVIRFVTHLDVSAGDIELVLNEIEKVVGTAEN